MNKQLLLSFLLLCILFLLGCKTKNAYITIEFYDYNNEIIETKRIGKDEDISFPTPKEREGYVFVSWEKLEESDVAIKYIAKYEEVKSAKEIAIEFYDKDNLLISSVTIKEGEEILFPAPKDYDGFSFISWEKSKETDSKVKYTAKYERTIKEITIEFYDKNDALISNISIKEGEEYDFPTPKEYKYYKFISWEKLKSTDVYISYKAKYEVTANEFDIKYITNNVSLNYFSKDEMIKSFLNDFYDFINPYESLDLFKYGLDYESKDITKGLWKNYLGGSLSNINRIIKDNDLSLKDDYYFFNNSYYGKKWEHLGKYIRDNVCKSNHRFGYTEKKYMYGALDFYRYIIGDHEGFIKTYGGEEVFYGYPLAEIKLTDKIIYGQDNPLPFVYNPQFSGWSYNNKHANKSLYCDEVMDYELIAEFYDTSGYNINIYEKDDDNKKILKTLNVYSGDEISLSDISLQSTDREGLVFEGYYLNDKKIKDTFNFCFERDIYIAARWKKLSENNLIDLEYNSSLVYYYGSYEPVKVYEKYEEKDTELRGVWVSSFVGGFKPSSDEKIMKNNLLFLLNDLESLNINAIFFHVRTHNNALYKSKLAPIKEEFGTYETFDNFDYLPWFIDQCHKRGIEFHAWLNPYRIVSNKLDVNVTPKDIALRYKDYPDNPASKEENILISYVSETERGAILNPCKKEVQEHIIRVIDEIIANYDVDGIHFDDYFYTKLNKTATPIDDMDVVDFENYIKSNNLLIDKNSREEMENWRRKNVDDLIELIHNYLVIKNKEKPKKVVFGISPTSTYRSRDGSVESGAYVNIGGHYDSPLYCDTYKWVKEEWIDYILPQAYKSFLNNFASITEWWNRALEESNVKLYIGLGSFNIYSGSGSWKYEEEIFNQLKYLQSLKNVKGVVLFSSTYISKYINNKTSKEYLIYEKLRKEYWTKKVKIN